MKTPCLGHFASAADFAANLRLLPRREKAGRSQTRLRSEELQHPRYHFFDASWSRTAIQSHIIASVRLEGAPHTHAHAMTFSPPSGIPVQRRSERDEATRSRLGVVTPSGAPPPPKRPLCNRTCAPHTVRRSRRTLISAREQEPYVFLSYATLSLLDATHTNAMRRRRGFRDVVVRACVRAVREGSGADTDERPKEPLIARSRSYSLGSIFILLTRLTPRPPGVVLLALFTLAAAASCRRQLVAVFSSIIWSRPRQCHHTTAAKMRKRAQAQASSLTSVRNLPSASRRQTGASSSFPS